MALPLPQTQPNRSPQLGSSGTPVHRPIICLTEIHFPRVMLTFTHQSDLLGGFSAPLSGPQAPSWSTQSIQPAGVVLNTVGVLLCLSSLRPVAVQLNHLDSPSGFPSSSSCSAFATRAKTGWLPQNVCCQSVHQITNNSPEINANAK